MSAPLRVVIADDEPELLEDLEELLGELGHRAVGRARNGLELIGRCRETEPDLVLTDIRMPELDGLDAVRAIFHERPVPVIILSAYHDPALIERATQGDVGVLGYLIKPVRPADLEVAIQLAVSRFREFQALFRQTTELRQALEERKVIERAKGILMKRASLDEQAAFERLQKLASRDRKKLVEIARAIVTTEDAFEP